MSTRPRKLELIQDVSGSALPEADLLLVHGICAGAWIWHESSMRGLTQAGYRTWALSLSGDAGDEVSGVPWRTLERYTSDLDEALRRIGRPKGAAGRIALPVAGDDRAAKAIVLNLVDELGFDGVDAGGLDESWRQQPGTPVYTNDFDAEGVRRALSEAKKDRTPEWRALGDQPPISRLSPT